MEKYRGFILKSETHRHEIREWDGHKKSGTGEYTTTYGYSIIRPKDCKSCWVVGDLSVAKSLVDKILDGKKEDRIARNKIKKAKKALDSYENKTFDKIEALKRSMWDKKAEVRELEESLKLYLLPDFY